MLLHTEKKYGSYCYFKDKTLMWHENKEEIALAKEISKVVHVNDKKDDLI